MYGFLVPWAGMLIRALLVLVLAFLLIPSRALAQEPLPDAVVQGCDGPPDLCTQLRDLNAKLAQARNLKKAAEAKVEEKVDKEVAKEVARDDQKKEERMAKLIAFAATLAVGLKILMSMLEAWKGYFTTIRGKAILKLVTLVVGFVAFMATNIGLGLPWWQSLILAGGGPGALLAHDLAEIIPALNGKKQKREDAKIQAKVDAKVAEVTGSVPPTSGT